MGVRLSSRSRWPIALAASIAAAAYFFGEALILLGLWALSWTPLMLAAWICPEDLASGVHNGFPVGSPRWNAYRMRHWREP